MILEFRIGTTYPQLLSFTNSAAPVFSVTISGQPAELACSVTVANPSSKLVKTKTCEVLKNLFKCL